MISIHVDVRSALVALAAAVARAAGACQQDFALLNGPAGGDQ